jgi:hypothetical protein
VNNKEREMAKSAQEKFNEYLDESRETMAAINEVSNRTNELYEGYAFAAGFLGMTLADAIAELPKARRAEFRERLLKQADKARNEFLLKAIKETA